MGNTQIGTFTTSGESAYRNYNLTAPSSLGSYIFTVTLKNTYTGETDSLNYGITVAEPFTIEIIWKTSNSIAMDVYDYSWTSLPWTIKVYKNDVLFKSWTNTSYTKINIVDGSPPVPPIPPGTYIYRVTITPSTGPMMEKTLIITFP